MLRVEEWGYSSPIISPLYSAPPLYWVNFEVQLVVYETDISNMKSFCPIL